MKKLLVKSPILFIISGFIAGMLTMFIIRENGSSKYIEQQMIINRGCLVSMAMQDALLTNCHDSYLTLQKCYLDDSSCEVDKTVEHIKLNQFKFERTDSIFKKEFLETLNHMNSFIGSTEVPEHLREQWNKDNKDLMENLGNP